MTMIIAIGMATAIQPTAPNMFRNRTRRPTESNLAGVASI